MQTEIRRAAEKLLIDYGIQGTTLQMLANDLGISKAAIYHYYSSKDALVRDVLQGWTRGRLEAAKAAATFPGEPIEKLHKFIELHILDIAEHMPLYGFSFRDEGYLPKEVREEFRALKSEIDVQLQLVINEGIVAGQFKPLNSRMVGFAIIGMCNWMWKWYRDDGALSPKEIADVVCALVIDGLAVTEGAQLASVGTNFNSENLNSARELVSELETILEYLALSTKTVVPDPSIEAPDKSGRVPRKNRQHVR
jgi:AcrR family transcriptional regulator